jgi:hypothetical protein
LKVILAAMYSFHGGISLSLLQKGLLSCVEETHESLERKSSMLDAAAYSTMFLYEN